MFNFEKLDVWHRAIAFADLVYAATRTFPGDERFGLTNQMRRAAVSISSNIAEGTSRVTWEIQQIGDSCRLTVTHDQLREGATNQLYGGWPMVLSGLKTLLETGELLTTPGSLRWMEGDRSQLTEVGGA